MARTPREGSNPRRCPDCRRAGKVCPRCRERARRGYPDKMRRPEEYERKGRPDDDGEG